MANLILASLGMEQMTMLRAVAGWDLRCSLTGIRSCYLRVISLSKLHGSNLRSCRDGSCSFQLVTLPSSECLLLVHWEFFGYSMGCTHLLIFHFKNLRLSLLALFLLMVSFEMWLSGSVSNLQYFQKWALQRKESLGWSWVITTLISTKFTLLVICYTMNLNLGT